MIDEVKLRQVVGEIKRQDPSSLKITVYSRPASLILRYLDLTRPLFSRGGAAAELLEEAVKKEYPELWERFTQETVPTTTKLTKSYWPKKFPRIDEDIWKQAIEEVSTRMGRLMTVYHPRIAAVLRYKSLTTPRFSISKVAGDLLNKALKERYPEIWEKAASA